MKLNSNLKAEINSFATSSITSAWSYETFRNLLFNNIKKELDEIFPNTEKNEFDFYNYEFEDDKEWIEISILDDNNSVSFQYSDFNSNIHFTLDRYKQ